MELRGPAGAYSVTTDTDGRYSFTQVEPGDYKVFASQAGFRMGYGEALRFLQKSWLEGVRPWI